MGQKLIAYLFRKLKATSYQVLGVLLLCGGGMDSKGFAQSDCAQLRKKAARVMDVKSAKAAYNTYLQQQLKTRIEELNVLNVEVPKRIYEPIPTLNPMEEQYKDEYGLCMVKRHFLGHKERYMGISERFIDT